VLENNPSSSVPDHAGPPEDAGPSEDDEEDNETGPPGNGQGN